MSTIPQRTIITVEDEAATRRLLIRQLEGAGYQVRGFENGRAATDAILELRNGIVIADWDMPEMNGIELLRFVRGMEEMSALGQIYFILLTANSEKSALVEGLEAGADDFVTKPYSKEELLARIRAGERMLNLQSEILRRQHDLAQANRELEQARLTLEAMASTDSLTELLNRRAAFDRLEQAWDVAARHGRPLSCIMLDIDKFKSVNDTYGHHAGDCVLKAVAAALTDNVRRHDVCGRFGGEEFFLILPETALDGAAFLAERLRAAIETIRVTCVEAELQVTSSFGVATRQPNDATPDAMVNRADAMLYRAKGNGRNQVWQIDGCGRAERVGGELVR